MEALPLLVLSCLPGFGVYSDAGAVLGVEKRKAELRLSLIKGGKTRAVLRRYSLPLLTRMENIVTTGTVLTYALWSSGPQVSGASTPYMFITLPFVLYGVFRYQLLSDPEEIARRSSNKQHEHGELVSDQKKSY
jgi:hypothetical protein